MHLEFSHIDHVLCTSTCCFRWSLLIVLSLAKGAHINQLMDREGVDFVAAFLASSNRGAESFCYSDEKEAFKYTDILGVCFS